MNLSPQNEANLEKLRINLAFLQSLLLQRAAIVPVIASLAATILVVATFNEKLLPLTEDIKLATVILLALIPLSLLFSLLEMHFAVERTVNAITEITGGKTPYALKSWVGKLRTILVAHTPFFLGIVLSIVIGWIIFVILGFEA